MSDTPIVLTGDSSVHLVDVKWTATDTSDPDETKDRWTEIEVHALRSGAYFVSVNGRTLIDGETDRCEVHYCTSAEKLIKSLLRPHRNAGRNLPGKHLPGYAARALRVAAEKDPLVRQELVAWESASRWAR